MQLDAFRCVGKRFDTSGNFQIFLDDLGDFWSWGLTFTDVLRIGVLTIIGANYWEVALAFTDQILPHIINWSTNYNSASFSKLRTNYPQKFTKLICKTYANALRCILVRKVYFSEIVV